jgi:hypothetical protein
MRHDAELEPSRQVGVSTERKLVGAIQYRGSKEEVGAGIVECIFRREICREISRFS